MSSRARRASGVSAGFYWPGCSFAGSGFVAGWGATSLGPGWWPVGGLSAFFPRSFALERFSRELGFGPDHLVLGDSLGREPLEAADRFFGTDCFQSFDRSKPVQSSTLPAFKIIRREFVQSGGRFGRRRAAQSESVRDVSCQAINIDIAIFQAKFGDCDNGIYRFCPDRSCR